MNKRVLLILLGCVTVGLLVLWHFALRPSMLVAKTRDAHVRRLFWAVAEFNGKHERLPLGLKEIVDAGILPQIGTIYYCPLKHDSFSEEALPYLACEYTMNFLPDKVVISLSGAQYGRYENVVRRGAAIEEVVTRETKATAVKRGH